MGAPGLTDAGRRHLHEELLSHIGRRAVPGLTAAVAHGDSVHVEALGRLRIDNATPVRRDTIFRISSMTKPITAVATLQLVEDGLLRLDDKIDRWLPEMTDRYVLRSPESELNDAVPARRAITVRDLLTFRLGVGILFQPELSPIGRAMEDRELGQGPPHPEVPPPPDEWMRRFGELPLIHQPGDRWMYSTGSDLLGVLIARASGRSFPQFLEDRLFRPLGMRDTAFYVDGMRRIRFGPVYGADEADGLTTYDESAGAWSRPPAFPSGAAGLVSTIDDFLAFAQMLAHDGELNGERILGAQHVKALRTDQLTPRQKAATLWIPGHFDRYGWGYGVSVSTAPTDEPMAVGTYGWDGGLGSSWTNDPERDVITIILTSRMMGSPVAPPVMVGFRRAAYQALR